MNALQAISCPGAIGADSPHLEIVDSLPGTLPTGRIVRGFHATPSEVLLDLPDLARWRIRGGSSIEISLEDPSHWPRVRCLTMSTPLAASILLRGQSPMLAGCAQAPGSDRATMICTPRGGGQSTILAALASLGWTILSDGLTRLSIEADGVMAHPGWAEIQLHPKACDLLGIPLDKTEVYPGLPNRRLLQDHQMGCAPIPVRDIVIVRRVDQRQRVQPDTWRRVGGLDAMTCLLSCSYDRRLVVSTGSEGRQFQTDQILATQARIFHWSIGETLVPALLASRIVEELG